MGTKKRKDPGIVAEVTLKGNRKLVNPTHPSSVTLWTYPPTPASPHHTVIDDVYNKVCGFFKDDERKTWLWFNTENPLLGGVSPWDMICRGRGEKLLKFVTTSIDENFPGGVFVDSGLVSIDIGHRV